MLTNLLFYARYQKILKKIPKKVAKKVDFTR